MVSAVSLSGRQVTWPMQNCITEITMNCTWDKSQLPNSFKIILIFSIHSNFLQYCEIPLKFFHDRQIYFPWGCQKWLSAWKFSFDSQTVAWFVRETRGISSCSWSVCLPVKTAELIDCLRAILGGYKQEMTVSFPFVSWKCRKLPQGIDETAIHREQGRRLCVTRELQLTGWLIELLRFHPFGLIEGFLSKFFACY